MILSLDQTSSDDKRYERKHRNPIPLVNMRFSSLFLLPLGLVLASPAPAPAPTPRAALERRQGTVAIMGATAVISNGVICGGLPGITGCLGQPAPNTNTATIVRLSGVSRSSARGLVVSSPTGSGRVAGTVTGDDFSVLFNIPTSFSSTATVATATENGGAWVTGRPAAAVAAGVGALVAGLL